MITMHDKTYREKIERIKYLEKTLEFKDDEITELRQQVADLKNIIDFILKDKADKNSIFDWRTIK